MTRRVFLSAIGLLFVVLLALRLTMPAVGMRAGGLGRLELVNFGLALAGILIFILVVLRLRETRMSFVWAAFVFLWLAACEPLMRGLLGGTFGLGAFPGPIERWFEIPVMLIALVAFIGYYDGSREPGLALGVAEAFAWAATVCRPSLIISGLDRLPLIGDLFRLSGDSLTFLLRMEQVFDAEKGLFLWPSLLGNAILAAGFVVALVTAAVPRASTIPERMRTA